MWIYKRDRRYHCGPVVECYTIHCRLARAFSSVNKHTCPLAIISVPIDDSFNSQYLVVLSRYLISRCDTYRDTWVTMRYVSRYLFIALVSPYICNLSMMAVQYIGLGTLYPITTIGAECAGRWPLPSY